MEVIKTKKELESVLSENNEKTVIVDFFAQWCSPCKALLPTLESIDEEYDNIKIVKVDVDESSDLANEYSIRSIPTLIIFKDGEVKGVSVGTNDKKSIINKVEELN